jgi:hypothetical protein
VHKAPLAVVPIAKGLTVSESSHTFLVDRNECTQLLDKQSESLKQVNPCSTNEYTDPIAPNAINVLIFIF